VRELMEFRSWRETKVVGSLGALNTITIKELQQSELKLLPPPRLSCLSEEPAGKLLSVR